MEATKTKIKKKARFFKLARKKAARAKGTGVLLRQKYLDRRRLLEIPVGIPARPEALELVKAARGGSMLALRSRLGLNRETFARLLPVSTRSLAAIEHGAPRNSVVSRRLTELDRIVQALREVINDEALGPWMVRPNQAFDGLKPIEVIERGEVDRIWQMVFLLRSGAPF